MFQKIVFFLLMVSVAYVITACGGSSEVTETNTSNQEQDSAPNGPTINDPVSGESSFRIEGDWYGFLSIPQSNDGNETISSLAYELQLDAPIEGVSVGIARVLTIGSEEEFQSARFGVRARVQNNNLMIEQLDSIGSVESRMAIDPSALTCNRTLNLSVTDDRLQGAWESTMCGGGNITLERPPEPSTTWFDQLPDCPCLLTDDLPGSDTNDKRGRPGSWSRAKGDGLLGLLTKYHPGAAVEIRWKPEEGSASGQQCTYDSNRMLITNGVAAGSPDLIAPGGPIEIKLHNYFDVAPYEDSDPVSRLSCAGYFLQRPPNNGNSCLDNVIGKLPDQPSELSCMEMINAGLIESEQPDIVLDLVPPLDTGIDSPPMLDAVPVSYTDPHLVTLDGLGYDFQAVGEFVLARSMLSGFEVQARQVQYGGATSPVSVNAGFAFNVDGNEVSIVPSPAGVLTVYVDGEAQPTSGQTDLIGGGRVAIKSNTFTIFWSDGSIAEVTDRSRFLNLSLGVNSRHASEITGLLGNFDGDAKNDLATSEGKDLTSEPAADELYGEFAEGWRLTDETSLFKYFDGQDTSTFTNRLIPNQIVSVSRLDQSVSESARAICIAAGITNASLLDNCILDVAVSGESDFANALIDVQQEYSAPNQITDVQGELKVPTLLCESEQLVLPEFNAELSGSFTNPDARLLWDVELRLNQCANNVVGFLSIVSGERFQQRRLVGTLEQGQLVLDAGFPINADGLAACRDMQISLVVSGAGLTGSWTASNCPQGGEINLVQGTLPDVFQMVGIWEGAVTQGSLSYPTSINLSVTDAEELVGTVDYPSLRCSGVLEGFQIAGTTVSFNETLTIPASCVQGGRVDLQVLSADTIGYEWFYPDGGSGATSTLKRIQ